MSRQFLLPPLCEGCGSFLPREDCKEDCGANFCYHCRRFVLEEPPTEVMA